MLRLPPFRYLAPRRLDDAVHMLAQEGEQAVLSDFIQFRPCGIKTGPRDRDASAFAGRDHRHHHEGNRLAAALGSRLPDCRGAQQARPNA